MESKKQKIALINTLLKYYDAPNNEVSNRLMRDIEHFIVGLSWDSWDSCNDIAESLYMRGKKVMNKLTNKQAYEIIRDNTNWAWVYPQDVKFKYGWIFHRTRDCCTGKFHSCKEPIDMYAIDSLYSYEHTGYQIEPWSGCEIEDSPFKKDNDSAVIKLIREVNRQYKSYKDDEFIEDVYEIAFGNDAIKKDYTRDDVLERLMEFSNNSLKLEEIEE